MMMGTLPRQSIPIVDLVKLSKQKNSIMARLSEMENEIHEHSRRLQRMDNNFKAMIYVILLYIVLYFIM
ncbi:unnamed protein product [Camellia sinensis]